MIIPVVLCGGAGTRLWPLSRRLYPKQFHHLHGEGSLLQQTARRADAVTHGGPLIVVTNDDQKFLVSDQLEEITDLCMLIEPMARNTAPAIALAAMYATSKFDDENLSLLVMPSDHLVTDVSGFVHMVGIGEQLTRCGKLVTFGVHPSSAETGYGYIEQGSNINSFSEAFEVKQFLEKPDPDTAQKLCKTGKHLWNSGIFMFDAHVYLEQLGKFCSAVHESCSSVAATMRTDGDFIAMEPDDFLACPNISIDYAVMERTSDAAVVSFAGAWSDIGSWKGLWEAERKVERHSDTDNITVGEVYSVDVTRSYIHSSDRMVAAVGLENMIIVETADAVMVTRRGEDQKVKELVEQLRADNRSEVEHHTFVYRPWGSYQSLQQKDHFQVKRLVIKPGASISLQLHHRRAEHWVVVRGTAVVTKGEEVFDLATNESTYIPRETVHKLENKGEVDLEIIEVQTGDYFGEDDIERIEDQYGRS